MIVKLDGPVLHIERDAIPARSGAMERSPSEEVVRALVTELADDPEHRDVGVTHESGWTLSAFAGGRMMLENVEELGVPVRWLFDMPRDAVVELFVALARGQLDIVEASPWRHEPGEFR